MNYRNFDSFKTKEDPLYTDITFDYVLNDNPLLKALVNIQINAGQIAKAFDAIANGMKAIIDKAWGLLGDPIKKKKRNV